MKKLLWQRLLVLSLTFVTTNMLKSCNKISLLVCETVRNCLVLAGTYCISTLNENIILLRSGTCILN